MAENTTRKSSRRFALVDMPDPTNLSAEFVYNFFVPDERTNANGDRRVPGVYTDAKTQRLVGASTLNTEVPRFIELNFAPGNLLSMTANSRRTLDLGDFDLSTFELSDVMDEEDITTNSFMTMIESDPDVTQRTADKLAALSNLLGIEFDDTEQSDKLSNFLALEQDVIQPLLQPTINRLVVNLNPSKPEKSFYDKAAAFTINAQMNVRTLDATFAGTDDVSVLSTVDERHIARSIRKQILSRLSSEVDLADIELHISPITLRQFYRGEKQPNLESVNHVGYVIERVQFGPDGNKIGGIRIPVNGTNNTRFLDSKIVYGSKYAYAVRNVYLVTAVMDVRLYESRPSSQFPMAMTFYVMSRPSATKTVETIETIPPKEPDGVFYEFNYNRGRGLIITWQMPVGKSRDTKFFQVFRRASIHEPFQCIAELNFDDSYMPTLRAEQVREDLVFYHQGPQTTFEDSTFDRESKPAIYAVCAVDAHGITSGYSAQTAVGFDTIRNEITLKNISRPGAPKQYPNFFIDPDLDDDIAVDSFTQDAIYDSGHNKVSVFFTPDAKIAKTLGGQNQPVFVTNESQGKYKFHFINLDVQESATVEMKIEDLL